MPGVVKELIMSAAAAALGALAAQYLINHVRPVRRFVGGL